MIAVLATRLGHCKVVGSVIDRALARGHRVTALTALSAKRGEAVTPSDLQRTWPSVGVRMLDAPARLAGQRPIPLDVLRPMDVHTLVGPMLWSTVGPEYLAECRQAGIRTISLDYCHETVAQPRAAVEAVDVTCYPTEAARDFHCEMIRAAHGGPNFGFGSAIVGTTMVDGLVSEGASERARVATWPGINSAPSRPSLVLFAAKFYGTGWWRRHVWRQAGYRRLVTALRRWCDHQGWALVVKSRAKHDDPAWLPDLADAYALDEDLYPHTSLRLLSTASLAVHFQSGAALECAAAGVPAVSIVTPLEHLRPYHHPDEWASVYGHERSMTAWPAVSDLTDERRVLAALDATPRIVTPEHDAYRARYVGPVDGRAGDRVVDLIEQGGR